MRKLAILIIALTLLCVTAATSQKQPVHTATPSQQQWEYGLYQVKKSRYAYEWLDNSQHIYAYNRQSFFEKLGVADALVKADRRYSQTLRPFPDYILDTIVLNHLGDQGWELVESSERVFRLKRRRSH